MKKLSTLTLLAAGLAAPAFAQTVITDDSLAAGVTYTWDADTEYILNGLVYLEEGGVLNVPAGTVIKGRTAPDGDASGDRTSALIITKGAQIFAVGTVDAPIIFTSESDDVTVADDLIDPESQRGLWGGLILLGNGTLAVPGGTSAIEGVNADEARNQYGGGETPNDTESSGRLEYVSIRHGGSQLSPDNEINGLTLGAIGSGTTIDYVEIFANLDDGIEFFGGTVDVKHASIAFCADDSYDYDLGWRGRGQYWFSLNGTDFSGRGGEFDGAEPDGQAPFSNPTIANATFLGSGVDALDDTRFDGDKNDFAIVMRDNAGGKIYNSVFTDFADQFLNIEDLSTDKGTDSYQRLLDGDITLAGNVLGSFGAAGDDGSLAPLVATYADGDQPDGADILTAITETNYYFPDSQLVAGISRTVDSKELDPRPAFGSALLDAGNVVALDAGDAGEGDFFESTDYVGAFGGEASGSLWLQGWTALSTYGILTDQVVPTKETVLSAIDVRISPNPTRGNANLDFSLLEASRVTIGVYDLNGRTINETFSDRAAGINRAVVTSRDLPTGTYLVRLVAGQQIVTKRLTVAAF